MVIGDQGQIVIETQAVPLALKAWGFAHTQLKIHSITTGLINQTFRIETVSGERYALQQLNTIFGREVHQDIAAVTEHLAGKHLQTPKLVRTQSGGLDIDLGAEMGLWRLMTWINGECQTQLSHPASAYEAGRMLGHFHSALADFKTPFVHTRLGIHDTPRHLHQLKSVLSQLTHHPNLDKIEPVAMAILTSAEALPQWDVHSERVVHGDPKVTNLIFSPEGKGLAWVDLDTVSRMALPLELGDAFRSWCNPSGEDSPKTEFRLDLFEAAVSGYANGANGIIKPWEHELFVSGCQQIALELAARFCRDALEERYFGWDPTRYASRSEHNLTRAKSQLALALDLGQKQSDAENLVKKAFS